MKIYWGGKDISRDKEVIKGEGGKDIFQKVETCIPSSADKMGVDNEKIY